MNFKEEGLVVHRIPRGCVLSLKVSMMPLMNDYEEDVDDFPEENKKVWPDLWSISRRVDRSIDSWKWDHDKKSEEVSGHVAGFVVTGLCLSRRTVLCTYHAHFCSQPGSSFCISVQERNFLFDGLACLLLNTLIIKVFSLEFEQVFLCELHTPPPLFPRVQRTAFTATTASVETVSK